MHPQGIGKRLPVPSPKGQIEQSRRAHGQIEGEKWAVGEPKKG